MMKIVGVVSILALTATVAGAQADDEDFLKFQQEQAAAFQGYVERTEEEFNAYIEADRKAFAAFKEEVEKVWGDYVGSSRKDWVEYGDGLGSRSKVDFEAGTATVEVVVNGDTETAQKNLQQAVADLVSDKGKSSDYSVALPDGEVEEPKPLSEKPVLEGQVATGDGKAVDADNAESFAQEVVQEAKVESKKVVGKDGKERIKVAVTFPLVPDHLRKRAESYRELVAEYANRFDLDPKLVFAVMHTESHFNPKARSHIPAYGLMQLVPTSGGREAYRYVYKKDEVLPAGYFYVPAQNIELGCGYLKYLRRRIFGKLDNDQKALYCMVAAYNTGAGNVSRAFTGKKAIRSAIPEIDKMGADEIYVYLEGNLPYEETRHYLKKVVERMALY
jgi:membrane-bound lytic murein transglycosylase C